MPGTYQQQAGGEEDPAHLEAAQHTAVPRRAAADHGHDVPAEPLNACGTQGVTAAPHPRRALCRAPTTPVPPQDTGMVLSGPTCWGAVLKPLPRVQGTSQLHRTPPAPLHTAPPSFAP